MTRLLLLLVLAFCNLAMAGEVSSVADPTIWDSFHFPEDISQNGHLIDWLFNYVTYAITFCFTLVVLGLVGFSFFITTKDILNPTTRMELSECRSM